MKFNNELINKNIMTLTLSTNATISATQTNKQKIEFDEIYAKTGGKLTLQNNGIRIGKGVSLIMVGASLRWGYSEPTTKNCSLYKNDEMLDEISKQQITANTVSHVPKVVPVAEGDIIYLYGGSFINPTGVIRIGTFLTVEVIK